MWRGGTTCDRRRKHTVAMTSIWAAEGNPVLPRVGAPAPVFEWIVMAILFSVVVSIIAARSPNERDRRWLPAIIGWGWVAKLLGSLARYYVVAFLYAGGDAFSYHSQAIFFANVWRNLQIPMSTAGGEGTAFTEVTSGLLYAIYTPSMVGGFLMFAFLAFIGQVFFYLAFRPWLADNQRKLYAIAIFFLPSVVFWPSSIGKDALMMLFLGVAVYGASRLLATYQFSSLLFLGPGIFLAAQIRPHVAALVSIAVVLAAIIGKSTRLVRMSPKRLVMIGAAVVATMFALAAFSNTFGVTIEGTNGTQDPTAFLDLVSQRTAQGGSEITGGAVGSISQLPAAVVTVLYRPLIYEANELQVVLSAIEGTILLLVTVWKIPAIWRNRRELRARALILMSFFYTGGFIIAFSAILNLGILARQRVQVLPMFLAVLIGLGWDRVDEPEPVKSGGPAGASRTTIAVGGYAARSELR